MKEIITVLGRIVEIANLVGNDDLHVSQSCDLIAAGEIAALFKDCEIEYEIGDIDIGSEVCAVESKAPVQATKAIHLFSLLTLKGYICGICFADKKIYDSILEDQLENAVNKLHDDFY